MFLLTHFLISFAWMQIKRNLAFRDNIDEIHFLSPLWLPPLSHSSIPPSVDFSIFPHVYPPSFPLFPPPCLASSQSLLCILAVTEVKHRQERKCIKKMRFFFFLKQSDWFETWRPSNWETPTLILTLWGRGFTFRAESFKNILYFRWMLQILLDCNTHKGIWWNFGI